MKFVYAEAGTVDTVYLTARKFIPVGNAFYEYLGGSNYPLFIEYTCTVMDQGANSGFGITRTGGAAIPVKSLLKDGGAYKLKLADEYQVVSWAGILFREKTGITK